MNQKTSAGIAAEMRKRILAGEFPPGSILPRAHALSADLGVGEPTVLKAYGLLRAENLVTPRKGVGSIVLDPSVRDKLTSHFMERDERGYFLRDGDTSYELLKHFGVQIGEASPDVAHRLNIEVGSEVIVRSRILGKPANRQEGQSRAIPMLLSTTYLPAWLAETVPGVKLESTSPAGIEDLIEEHFQQPLSWGMYGTANTATPEQSTKLSTANQAALLRMQRVASLPDGRVVELVDQFGAATNFEIYYPIPRAVSAQWSGITVGAGE